MVLPQVLHKLERVLGPGTTELQLRIGLHSGPVTAGVLRGDKARFQLFGDTVNTTAGGHERPQPCTSQRANCTASYPCRQRELD